MPIAIRCGHDLHPAKSGRRQADESALDICGVARERLAIIGEVINGPADLVAEVISPESRRRDRFDKRDLYEQHGVREYWLLDPEAETVEVFHLTDGQYRLLGRWRPGETAASRLLQDFMVPVAGLFGEA